MDSAATLIISRLDALERNREADRSEAKDDRHGFRNELFKMIGSMEVRLGVLERSQNGSGARAENRWMKWALGVEGAIIGFLAYMVWGHK